MYRILIADDDQAVRTFLQKVCETLRWEVEVAEDGRRAIDLMRQSSHDIFVVDVKMPGPSGLELAREIFKHEIDPSIIILTGHAEIGQAVQAMKEGVFDYIQKDEIADFDRLSRLFLRAASHRDAKRYAALSKADSSLMTDVNPERIFLRDPLLKALKIAVFLARSDNGRIVECNSAAAELLGYSTEELLGSSLVDVIPDLDASTWESLVLQAGRHSSPLFLEKKLLHRNQSAELYELTLKPCNISDTSYIFILAKNVCHYAETHQVLDRVRISLETKLKAFSQILNQLEYGIILTDSAHRILFFNSWILKDWQIPSTFLQGKDAPSRLQELLKITVHETLQAFQNGLLQEEISMEYNNEKSGTVILTPLNKEGQYGGACFQIYPESHTNTAKALIGDDYLGSFRSVLEELLIPMKEMEMVSENLRLTSLDPEQTHWLDVQQQCLKSLRALIGNFTSTPE